MARERTPLQINEFSGGLNTEFNPLKMPPNISIDELNMDIQPDGSRRKRLGFGYESGYEVQNSSHPYAASTPPSITTFSWENAGGDPEKRLICVAVGSYLGIHDPDDETSLSSGLVYSENFTSEATKFSFTVVDSLLVVVTGEKLVNVYEYYPDTGTVNKETNTLLIRDLFGVEAGNLTDSNNLDERPDELTDEHLYNLRNQTFRSPYYPNNDEILEDPITSFYTSTTDTSYNPNWPLAPPSGEERYERYPSNADDLNYFLYADPNDAGDRLIERFFADHMAKSHPAVGESSKGHFIIDALERGASRETEEQNLRLAYPELDFAITSSLPVDKTPGGATVVGEFSGRVCYGGFSGQVIGGDSKSPRMSSYILFSRLVKDKTDISQCYQRADPTSHIDSALVDTDGGFLRLDNAYGVNKFINLEGGLLVFARNGIWRVSGGEGVAFSATSYQVDRLSSDGCISGDSVVVVGDKIFYWSDKGIYGIAKNQYGQWIVENLTDEVIKTYYDNLDEDAKRVCSGYYDNYEGKIRWVFTPVSSSTTESRELILDIDTGAFCPFTVQVASGAAPLIVSVLEGNPYSASDFTEVVTSSGTTVTSSSVDVTVTVSQRTTGVKSSVYLVLTEFDSTVYYTFGKYNQSTYYDWDVTSYEAFLQAGHFTGGEARYKKQVPYLNVFMQKTETGFDSNLDLVNESSCLVSARWNWTDSLAGKKWTTPRQAYRLNNVYFPTSSADTFDTGETVISSRNKIRGMGNSVSFKFESEAGKAMHIHGWAFDISVEQKE